MEQAPLKNSDVLILTCLTQTPLAQPDPMIGEFCQNSGRCTSSGGFRVPRETYTFVPLCLSISSRELGEMHVCICVLVTVSTCEYMCGNGCWSYIQGKQTCWNHLHDELMTVWGPGYLVRIHHLFLNTQHQGMQIVISVVFRPTGKVQV